MAGGGGDARASASMVGSGPFGKGFSYAGQKAVGSGMVAAAGDR
jgi:hypothetical protein